MLVDRDSSIKNIEKLKSQHEEEFNMSKISIYSKKNGKKTQDKLKIKKRNKKLKKLSKQAKKVNRSK